MHTKRTWSLNRTFPGTADRRHYQALQGTARGSGKGQRNSRLPGRAGLSSSAAVASSRHHHRLGGPSRGKKGCQSNPVPRPGALCKFGSCCRHGTPSCTWSWEMQRRRGFRWSPPPGTTCSAVSRAATAAPERHRKYFPGAEGSMARRSVVVRAR